jgi:hypothetical protein
MANLLVVLDLDETLIHSRNAPTKRTADFTLTFKASPELYYVHKRPGLVTFLSKLRHLMKHTGLRVGVWTAANDAYAQKILDRIWSSWRDDLSFLRTRKHCTSLDNGATVKDLRRLPRSYVTLLVDDNPDTHAFNTQNGFFVWKIKPFTARSAPTPPSPTSSPSAPASLAPDRELARVLAHVKSLLCKLTPPRPLSATASAAHVSPTKRIRTNKSVGML